MAFRVHKVGRWSWEITLDGIPGRLVAAVLLLAAFFLGRWSVGN